MKYFELEEEEKQILKDFNNNEFGPVKNEKNVKLLHQKYAQAFGNKKKNINIRLSEGDLQKLKAKAIEEGIPYQTLIASLIHKYTTRIL